MPEGLYEIIYSGVTGNGQAVIVLIDGRVVGTDGGVDYDGTYDLTGVGDRVKADIQCSVHAGTELVTGVPAQTHPYSFGISVEFPATGQANGTVMTPFGPVNVGLKFLRGLN